MPVVLALGQETNLTAFSTGIQAAQSLLSVLLRRRPKPLNRPSRPTCNQSGPKTNTRDTVNQPTKIATRNPKQANHQDAEKKSTTPLYSPTSEHRARCCPGPTHNKNIPSDPRLAAGHIPSAPEGGPHIRPALAPCSPGRAAYHHSLRAEAESEAADADPDRLCAVFVGAGRRGGCGVEGGWLRG